jgi:periplasmic protein CpxP/Spy
MHVIQTALEGALMNTTTNQRIHRQPVRRLALLLGTLVVATAATMSQTAWAQPHGMHGGPGMGGGMMGMMGHGRGMERVLDSVNATAEQRSQIKALVDAARADMRAQHDSGRQLREQGAALFAQPTFDARAAEALRQQMLARHDAASKRTMQLMLDVSRVLTPEQRKTLADKMAQRRAMMERHRGERDALDGARKP